MATSELTKKEVKELYKLEPGESMNFRNNDVLRVPGGWLFRPITSTLSNTVFIPYNSEFDNL